MSLSQAALDRVARAGKRMYGPLMESVSYCHKASAAAPGETSALQMHVQSYRQHQIDDEVILREDQRGRVASVDVGFAPGPYDEFVRADGSVWRVIHAEGGAGHPWWFLHCRKVG